MTAACNLPRGIFSFLLCTLHLLSPRASTSSQGSVTSPAPTPLLPSSTSVSLVCMQQPGFSWRDGWLAAGSRPANRLSRCSMPLYPVRTTWYHRYVTYIRFPAASSPAATSAHTDPPHVAGSNCQHPAIKGIGPWAIYAQRAAPYQISRCMHKTCLCAWAK